MSTNKSSAYVRDVDLQPVVDELLVVQSNQLPNDHDVTVTNQPADPATATKQDALLAAVESGGSGAVSTTDAGNTYFYTDADGTTPFVGSSYDCRDPNDLDKRLVAAQQIVLASNVPTGLGGTLVFEYSADDITWYISESRPITGFETVRDLTLQTPDNFFRLQFTPDRALAPGEFVNISAAQWFITPPPFVRLADQQIEKQNAAMGQSFAYLKGFGLDGISSDVPLGGLDPQNTSLIPLQNTDIGTFIADDTTDIISLTAHGKVDGDYIVLKTTTGASDALPAPLVADQLYFVVTATANTFQLALTAGGTAIDITDAGVGTHTAMAPGTWEGDYTKVVGMASGQAFSFGLTPLSRVRLQWSSDGSTPALGAIGTSAVADVPFVGAEIYLEVIDRMLHPYVRMEVINGSSSQFLNESYLWLDDKPNIGTHIGLTESLSSLSSALLTRSVLASVGPDGGFDNLTSDGLNALHVNTGSTVAVFGDQIISQRKDQLSVNFSQETPDNVVNVDITGTGHVTNAAAQSVVGTGATAGSTALMETRRTVKYRPGHEIYAFFTATFSEPSADGSQFIGLFDNDNGFCIGYEGLDFCIRHRNAAIDVDSAQSSWNGESTALFTRDGVVEDIDFQKGNVFRIRFGWLGNAPIKFEALAPDGRWVLLHTIKYPNSSVLAHIEDPDLPLRSEVLNNADAVEVSIATSSWAAGVTIAPVIMETLYQKRTPVDDALPSGAAIVVHPTLNTEANVFDSGWIAVTDDYPGGQLATVQADTSLNVYLLNASDDLGNNIEGADFYSLVTFPNAPSVTGAPFFDDYYRIIIENTSGVDATVYTIRSQGTNVAPAPIYQSLDQPLFDFIPAPVVQSIAKGRNADGQYIAVPITGTQANLSTITPLLAGESWPLVPPAVPHALAGWVGSVIFIKTDQKLDLELQHSESGVFDDPNNRIVTLKFDPTIAPQGIPYHIPAWSRYLFVQLKNTSVFNQAQLSFTVGHTQSRFQPAALPIGGGISDATLGEVANAIIQSKNDLGVHGQILRSAEGGFRIAVLEHEVSTPIRALDFGNTGQGSAVASSVISIPPDGTGSINRKTIEFSNHSSAIAAYYVFDNKKLLTPEQVRRQGKILRGGSDTAIEVNESVNFFWTTDDAGGSAADVEVDATTATGTATTPTNAIASDNVYASLLLGQTLDIGGFAYSQAGVNVNAITAKIEGRKAATPATATVVHEQVASGATANSASVATSSLAGGTAQLYIAAVTRNATNNVSGVSGGGLTWIPLIVNITGGGRSIDLWYAYGDATAGAVTASMTSSTNAHISASRWSGADADNPIEDSGSSNGSGTAVTGPSLTSTDLGGAFFAVSHEATSATQGAGYTERYDQSNGSGGNSDSLATQTRTVTPAGATAGTMTLSSSQTWMALAARIRPAPTADISYDVFADVDGGGFTLISSITFTTTTDEVIPVDLSGVVPANEAGVNDTTVRLVRTTAGTAAGRIDKVHITVNEGDDDTSARISYAEVADTEFAD